MLFMQYDVVIIGAGAAGLMCAATAGARGKKVLLLDHARKPGEKIRISGGGRCNFTNIHASPANYLSANPRFCVSALSRYRPADFIKLVENYGIAYHEKTLGQLFCDGSSQQIIDMLLDLCRKGGVTIRLENSVAKISRSDPHFTLKTKQGEVLESASLVIATGGLSIPKMGATDFGYRIARQFGLNMIEPRAALVPFTLVGKTLQSLQPLSGVSLPVEVSCGKARFREAMLFTHRGLSGPAILQISSYWQEGKHIAINLLPDKDVFDWLKTCRDISPKQDITTTLAHALPKRLAQYLCEAHGFQGRLADLSNKALQATADAVSNWQMIPEGTEGYRTAEVTIGGVDTDELSSKTLEAKKVPDLYFIGEVVDVTGHLGGFNFQWAWASAVAAGEAV
jgi:predicted Rossmann fold flavoprotein